MIEIEKRETVWVCPGAGMVFPGIVLKRRFGFIRVLYWDADGEHHRVTVFLPSKDILFPRATEPWSASCGSMVRPLRS